MSLKERVIDVFEGRVKKLIEIADISKLPRWTEGDVIAADCLLKQYRNLTSSSSRAADVCGGCGLPLSDHHEGERCPSK